jgi:hydroxyethylthiazole kinase
VSSHSASEAGRVLARVRERRPRIHCITNDVVMALTANVLLAVGARPSMTVDPEEVGDFVAAADALLVNLGTLDDARRRSIPMAVSLAVRAGKPWVLDPVMVDVAAQRLALARRIVVDGPAVIRGNAAEIAALAADTGDSLDDDTGDASEAGRLARARLCVVARTGAVDVITDGTTTATVDAGDPRLAAVTGAGCAAAALVTAFVAVDSDALGAAAAALLVFGVAAMVAAESAGGPGTLGTLLIDALHGLDDGRLRQWSDGR